MNNSIWEGSVGAVLAAVIGVFAVVFRPWSDESKLRRAQKRIVDLFISGDPGTKGLIDTILPAPIRMQTLEHATADHEQILREQDSRIAKIEKTVYEGQEVLSKVQSGITNLTREFIQYRDDNARNGGNSPGMGDSLLRIEQALGIASPASKAGEPHE